VLKPLGNNSTPSTNDKYTAQYRVTIAITQLIAKRIHDGSSDIATFMYTINSIPANIITTTVKVLIIQPIKLFTINTPIFYGANDAINDTLPVIVPEYITVGQTFT
jgi:hypothetical protein